MIQNEEGNERRSEWVRQKRECENGIKNGESKYEYVDGLVERLINSRINRHMNKEIYI